MATSLLDELAAEQAAWEDLLAEIGEHRMEIPGVQGDWSIKDIIAHLTAWRQRTVARFQADLDGAPVAPPWPADRTTDDEINDWIYATARGQPLAAVLADSRRTYDSLVAVLAAFPAAELADPQRFAWLEGNPVRAADLFGHFHEEHEPDIRAWLARQQQRG